MRVVTLFVRHGTEKYANAAGRVEEFYRNRMPLVERRFIIIDNALSSDVVQATPEGTLLGGDNRHWEFSGWDKAIQFLGDEIRSYDYVHFLTSAFEELYVAYIERFSAQMLMCMRGQGAAIGHIDCYNEPVHVLGFALQHWLRSSFFFVPPAEVLALGSMVSVPDGRPFFSGDPTQPFRPDAPISDNFKRTTIEWLTGAGTGQGVEWHSRFDLTLDTLGYFERKCLAILNEALLSARLRALGCVLIDTTWLATRLTQGSGAPLGYYSWMDQLRGRDRDSIAVGPLPV
jgi:hypothetical protein